MSEWFLFNANSAHWNNILWIDMSSHSETLSDSERTNLCSFSLMLYA